MGRTFKSKYEFTCTLCGETIEEGDLVVKFFDTAVHEECDLPVPIEPGK